MMLRSDGINKGGKREKADFTTKVTRYIYIRMYIN